MISTMKETVIRGNWGIKCRYRGIRGPLGLLSWKLVNFISGSSAPVQGRQAEREGKARGREGESEGRTEGGRQGGNQPIPSLTLTWQKSSGKSC